jgi:hypothetical protein
MSGLARYALCAACADIAHRITWLSLCLPTDGALSQIGPLGKRVVVVHTLHVCDGPLCVGKPDDRSWHAVAAFLFD